MTKTEDKISADLNFLRTIRSQSLSFVPVFRPYSSPGTGYCQNVGNGSSLGLPYGPSLSLPYGPSQWPLTFSRVRPSPHLPSTVTPRAIREMGENLKIRRCSTLTLGLMPTRLAFRGTRACSCVRRVAPATVATVFTATGFGSDPVPSCWLPPPSAGGRGAHSPVRAPAEQRPTSTRSRTHRAAWLENGCGWLGSAALRRPAKDNGSRKRFSRMVFIGK